MSTIKQTRWLTRDEKQCWVAFVQLLTVALSRLESQMQADSGISHYEYGVMARLSEAPRRTVVLSQLADMSNGSLSRLSHAMRRLERHDWVRRSPCASDGRLTEATLTDAGMAKVTESAPGHVRMVRSLVFDALTPEQSAQLRDISLAILNHDRSKTAD
ncbi:MAG: MarR family transcriptional regulator [Firmicutes bacterium]|nr:MarR family transcriptional regulator [Bacillota bacterium]